MFLPLIEYLSGVGPDECLKFERETGKDWNVGGGGEAMVVVVFTFLDEVCSWLHVGLIWVWEKDVFKIDIGFVFTGFEGKDLEVI